MTSQPNNSAPDSSSDSAATSAPDDPCANPDACRDAVAELFVFLDGELTSDRKATIGRHLDDCGHCLETFEFHSELRAVVSQKCRTELPAGLKDRVLGALRALDD